MGIECGFCSRSIQNKHALEVHEISCEQKLALNKEKASLNGSGLWTALTIAIAIGTLTLLAIMYLQEPEKQEIAPTQQIVKPEKTSFSMF